MVKAQIENTGDAPFGIRALESGIEIEGVWISRTNTPVPSRPSSISSFVPGSSSSSFFDEPTTPSFAIIERPTKKNQMESTQSTQFTQPFYTPSKRTSIAESTASRTIDTNGFKQLEVYRPRPLSTSATKRPHHSSNSATSHTSDSSSIDRTRRRCESPMMAQLDSEANVTSLDVFERR
jgi:hypothetical protein